MGTPVALHLIPLKLLTQWEMNLENSKLIDCIVIRLL